MQGPCFHYREWDCSEHKIPFWNWLNIKKGYCLEVDCSSDEDCKELCSDCSNGATCVDYSDHPWGVPNQCECLDDYNHEYENDMDYSNEGTR